VFDTCLHRYLIKDAIADENVLGFLVEYYKENGDVDVMEEKRMREIAQFILNNFNKSTYDGDFTLCLPYSLYPCCFATTKYSRNSIRRYALVRCSPTLPMTAR
jgi:hypothetical protein